MEAYQELERQARNHKHMANNFKMLHRLVFFSMAAVALLGPRPTPVTAAS